MKSHIVEHVETLATAPRVPGNRQHKLAQKLIYEHMDKLGWNPEMQTAHMVLKKERVDVSNIVSVRGPATAPLVIVAAHYDSVTTSPGADDNASGVAGLLNLAQKLGSFHPKHARLMLVAYDHEEYGMSGSRIHTLSLLRQRETVKGMASLEMIGYTSEEQEIPEEIKNVVKRTDGKFLVTATNYDSRELIEHVPNSPFVEKLAAPPKSKTEMLVSLSDNSSFWDRGYPAMIVTDTAFLRNPHYHRKTDTADRLDYGFLEDTVGVIESWVESMTRK